MQQPQGFIDSSTTQFVCKLHKSIYGLKQTPHAWFERFTSHLLIIGFQASMKNPVMFIYRSHSTILFLLVYVNDIINVGNLNSNVTNLIKNLPMDFELKDLAPLTYFLGFQIKYTPHSFFIRYSLDQML